MAMKTRRAPTPNGLYGCKCIRCGTYFGSVRENTRFCSGLCRTNHHLLIHRRWQSRVRKHQAMLDEMNGPFAPAAPVRDWAAARHPLAGPLESEQAVEDDPK
jgi:hypothetical protein